METKKPTVLIVLEGGIVQDVVCDVRDVFGRVLVIDYDTDGMDEDDLFAVEQSDGSTADALVYDVAISKPSIDLKQFDAVEKS